MTIWIGFVILAAGAGVAVLLVRISIRRLRTDAANARHDVANARREVEDARSEVAATCEYIATFERAVQHPGEWQRVPSWAQRPGSFTGIRWQTPRESGDGRPA